MPVQADVRTHARTYTHITHAHAPTPLPVRPSVVVVVVVVMMMVVVVVVVMMMVVVVCRWSSTVERWSKGRTSSCCSEGAPTHDWWSGK